MLMFPETEVVRTDFEVEVAEVLFTLGDGPAEGSLLGLVSVGSESAGAEVVEDTFEVEVDDELVLGVGRIEPGVEVAVVLLELNALEELVLEVAEGSKLAEVEVDNVEDDSVEVELSFVDVEVELKVEVVIALLLVVIDFVED